MSRKLIVSADDFGFSPAYSLGAVRACTEGVATVLALMSNMDAAPFAVDLWRCACPEVQLAQHTNFVQGRPVSPPETIPSLVDENGMFYRSSQWRGDGHDGGKGKGDVYPSYEDLRRETRAQAERFRELTGSYPRHLEGHSMMTSPMRQAFLDVAGELGIHCMGQEPLENERMRSCAECDDPGRGKALTMDILTRGSTPEDWEKDAFGVLECPYEIAILHFHPGYIDQYVLDNTSLTLPRCKDLETICDPRVRAWIEGNDIELVDFSAAYK